MQTFEQELDTRNIIRVNASTVKSKYWRGNTIFSNKLRKADPDKKFYQICILLTNRRANF